MRADCAGGCQHAYAAVCAEPAGGFNGGAYHSEHAPRRVEIREVALLNRTQRLGRRRVAGKDDEVASALEQRPDSLKSELIDNVKRAGAVGSAGVVAEVEVVVMRQSPPHFFENCQAAVARIEHSDRAGSCR